MSYICLPRGYRRQPPYYTSLRGVGNVFREHRITHTELNQKCQTASPYLDKRQVQMVCNVFAVTPNAVGNHVIKTLQRTLNLIHWLLKLSPSYAI